MTCKSCGGLLERDAPGANKKFIARDAVEFFCLTCLAEHFRTTKDFFEERIAFLKRNGCTLFPPDNP